LNNQTKSIWIVGGSTGIGYALAKYWVNEGFQVYISARSQSTLEQVASSLGDLCVAVVADVTNQDSLSFAWHKVCADGLPSKVVYCSGNHHEMPAAEFNSDTCKSLMEVNYIGLCHLLDNVLSSYHDAGGQIAVVSSLAGYRGLPKAAAYGASKAAVINFCEALRVELQGSKVDLRLINPGFVRTPLTDKNEFEMPFLVEPDVAAKRISDGLNGSSFEIRFPRRFAYILAFMKMLPYSVYFPLVKRMTKQ